MFENMQVTTQPVFYLFLAASLLLSLGYAWGKRKNTKIHLSTFNAIVGVLRPKDQTFTNIGGLTGYHANIIPKNSKVFRRVDLTLTLLARQSWLYLPFSLITKHTDRLYATFLFGKKVKPSFKEAHLIDRKLNLTNQGSIDDPGSFESEQVVWGERNFILYTKDEALKGAFKKLISTLTSPGGIRHISFVPAEGKVYLFLIPGYNTVAPVFEPLYEWITHTVKVPSGDKQE